MIIIHWLKLPAQDYYCNCDINGSGLVDIEKKLSGRIFISNFINYDSQFFYKWSRGDVILCDGTVLNNKYIRYNLFLDELIWSRKTDYKAAIVDKQSVKGFIIYSNDSSHLLQFRKTSMKNWYEADSTDIFLQVLAEGPVSLYAFRKIELIENKIYNTDKYYLLLGNTYYNFKPSRRRLLKLFPENKFELRQILRKNNLLVRKEDQLIRAIELYNKTIGPGK